MERPTRAPLPNPKATELANVEWKVIQTADGPVIALTPAEHERLMLNLAEILRWVQEAMWRLQYYGRP